MEVILLQKVRNLGGLGDQVRVKPGYGRNYLVPKGIALPATKENIRVFEAQKSELQKASADRLERATARADELRGRSFTVPMRASDEGKLYGSVGPQEIADKVNEEGYELDPSEVTLPEGGVIRQTGEHHAVLQLHAEVEVEITVIVAQLTDMGVNMPDLSEEEEAALLGEEIPAEEHAEAGETEQAAAEEGAETAETQPGEASDEQTESGEPEDERG